MNSKLMYLRDKNNNPCGCVVMLLDKKNHRVSYQYSVQNPSDHFDRDLGRHIALGRLVDQPISIPLSRKEEINTHMISALVMSHLATTNSPKRATQAAIRWMNTSHKSAT